MLSFGSINCNHNCNCFICILFLEPQLQSRLTFQEQQILKFNWQEQLTWGTYTLSILPGSFFMSEGKSQCCRTGISMSAVSFYKILQWLIFRITIWDSHFSHNVFWTISFQWELTSNNNSTMGKTTCTSKFTSPPLLKTEDETPDEPPPQERLQQ